VVRLRGAIDLAFLAGRAILSIIMTRASLASSASVLVSLSVLAGCGGGEFSTAPGAGAAPAIDAGNPDVAVQPDTSMEAEPDADAAAEAAPSDACGPGLTPCGGGCVDTSSDLGNCGGCGKACTVANGGGTCELGLCKVASCTAGFDDCNHDASDGCEKSLKTALDCGACGVPCLVNGSPGSCATGQCKVSSCPALTEDCDGNAANGCETSLETLTNCGACGQSCSRANADATCAGGKCAIAKCKAPFGDCDGQDANGCETNTSINKDHCGGCGKLCDLPHASSICNAGACQILSCAAGWTNCNPDQNDGCETDTFNDTSNCGGCALPCKPPNAAGACSNGKCKVASCSAGWDDCNKDPQDGCEVHLGTNAKNCGGCGRACSNSHTLSLACSGGKCASSCQLGWGNCNMPGYPNTDDGCERTVSQNDKSCGSCSNDCGAINTSSPFVCGGAMGKVNQCLCDADIDCGTNSTYTTCDEPSGVCSCWGGVGPVQQCRPGERCLTLAMGDGGTGVMRCSCNGGLGCQLMEQTCCQSPAGCRDLGTSPDSCGACGRACPPAFLCAAGTCGCTTAASCNAGSSGSCVTGALCNCGGITCAAGERCQADGTCG
jgi:hypothetical protein